MTPSGPLHLDLDQLADALAGEQHGHLVGCAHCTSRLAELAAAEDRVVAALHAMTDPAIPPGLAERLAAAFAAEPPLAEPVAEPPAAPQTETPQGTTLAGTVTALPAPAPRRRFLPAVAAAVLLASAGGLGYALVTSSTSGNDAADSGAAAASAAELLLSTSGTDYADAAAVTGALPRVLAGGATALQRTDGAAGAAQAPEADAAAPDATRDSTEVQAPAVAAIVEDPLARLRTPAGLEDCLSAVLPPEEPDLRPLALDYASYQGQPALAVLLPDPDPAKLSVYVVGPDCAAADAKVLGFLRVDAP